MSFAVSAGCPFSAARASIASMAATQPGVQKPHCEPWPSAMAFWTAEKPADCEPKPSTVVISSPSHAHSRRRHELMARGIPSAPRTTHVQAPQPPSPQPILVPVRPSVSRR